MISLKAVEVELKRVNHDDDFMDRQFYMRPTVTEKPIGRSSSRNTERGAPLLSNIYFKSPLISRNHAVLKYSPPSTISIVDHDSLHGTSVNGEVLSPYAAKVLVSGDLIVLGCNINEGSSRDTSRCFRVFLRPIDEKPSVIPISKIIDLSSPAPDAHMPKVELATGSFEVPDACSVYSDESSDLDELPEQPEQKKNTSEVLGSSEANPWTLDDELNEPSCDVTNETSQGDTQVKDAEPAPPTVSLGGSVELHEDYNESEAESYDDSVGSSEDDVSNSEDSDDGSDSVAPNRSPAYTPKSPAYSPQSPTVHYQRSPTCPPSTTYTPRLTLDPAESINVGTTSVDHRPSYAEPNLLSATKSSPWNPFLNSDRTPVTTNDYHPYFPYNGIPRNTCNFEFPPPPPFAVADPEVSSTEKNVETGKEPVDERADLEASLPGVPVATFASMDKANPDQSHPTARPKNTSVPFTFSAFADNDAFRLPIFCPPITPANAENNISAEKEHSKAASDTRSKLEQISISNLTTKEDNNTYAQKVCGRKRKFQVDIEGKESSTNPTVSDTRQEADGPIETAQALGMSSPAASKTTESVKEPTESAKEPEFKRARTQFNLSSASTLPPWKAFALGAFAGSVGMFGGLLVLPETLFMG